MFWLVDFMMIVIFVGESDLIIVNIERTRTGTDQDNNTYESLKKRHRSHSQSHSPPSKSSLRDKGRRSKDNLMRGTKIVENDRKWPA